MLHGARTADDKVAPALLGTHSNWHGLESLRAQREREDNLHGYCGLLSDDYPSDGIREMRIACQRAPTLLPRLASEKPAPKHLVALR